jgi:hypothetical protein
LERSRRPTEHGLRNARLFPLRFPRRRVIDDKRPNRVRRCLICGHEGISTTGEGRTVTTSCTQCRAVLKIEFDPPDEPAVRARIERIDEAE